MALGRVYFYRQDGSEQRSMHYSAPGRGYMDHDMDFWDIEVDAYPVNSIRRIHCGHGIHHDYKVVACDSHTLLLQRV